MLLIAEQDSISSFFSLFSAVSAVCKGAAYNCLLHYAHIVSATIVRKVAARRVATSWRIGGQKK